MSAMQLAPTALIAIPIMYLTFVIPCGDIRLRLRHMTTPLERLLALPLDEGRLLIMTHDNPDPDSLASACALAHLLRERRGLDPVVAYTGVIGRAENRAMMEQLDLPVVHLDTLVDSEFHHFALVDAQPFTGNNTLPDDINVDIVIDHHPLRSTTRTARFFDVRDEVGASASILTLYLREAEVPIPRDLATALLYGIRSETADLAGETAAEDVAAYRTLLESADPALLGAIARPRLRREYYDQLSRALGGIETNARLAYAWLGNVTDADFVPEFADLIVRMEEIDWSLVCGELDDIIYLSIRSNVIEAEAGTLMQEILDGHGQGGGHGTRAGGRIPLDRSTNGSEIGARMRERMQERLSESLQGGNAKGRST